MTRMKVLESVTVDIQEDDGGNEYFHALGQTFAFDDFLAAHPVVAGDALSAELERLGFHGWTPRGGGNADTAAFAVSLEDYYRDDTVTVALIDNDTDEAGA